MLARVWVCEYEVLVIKESQLDLAFNDVKPKDWYFVLD